MDRRSRRVAAHPGVVAVMGCGVPLMMRWTSVGLAVTCSESGAITLRFWTVTRSEWDVSTSPSRASRPHGRSKRPPIRDQRPRTAAPQARHVPPSGSVARGRAAAAAGHRDRLRMALKNRFKDRLDTSGHPQVDRSCRSRLGVHALVNRRDFLDPSLSFRMLEGEDLLARPVKVISNEGYLLVQRREGVADHPPASSIPTSKVCSHFGQRAGIVARPSWLIRL